MFADASRGPRPTRATAASRRTSAAVALAALLSVVGATGPAWAAGTEETGSWSGTGPYSAMAHVVTVTATATASGNAGFTATPTGAFGTANFWSTTLTSDASLEVRPAWDTNPESGGTDIDLGSDDKGSGTLTFAFDRAVTNPVLHVDRIGGQGSNISNSLRLTLTTGGVTLTRLSGTDDFDVTATTIQRRPDVTTDTGSEAHQGVNTGTAAGSVRINGTVTSVAFGWTGVGVEGAGADQLEFVWSVPVNLAIVKRAFQLDGTPIASGSTLPNGVPVRFLLYVNNDGPAITDVSLSDLLDAAFLYRAGSLLVDSSVANCAAATCTPAEEAAILASVVAGTSGTDAVDGDGVSRSGATLHVGHQTAANAQVNVPANRILAVAFTVTLQ